MLWPLDEPDQQRLVSALLRIDIMRERKSRDLFVAALQREVWLGEQLIRHEQARLDVWRLVDACLARSGAIHVLIGILENFTGNSTTISEVRALVAELLPQPLLTITERRELRKVIRALETEGISADFHAMLPMLYRRAVGPVGPVLSGEVRRVSDIVVQLEEVTAGADRIPPLLIFISDLAAAASGPSSAAARDWLKKCAERLNVDTAQLLRSVPDHKGRHAYLAIECRPDGAESGGYLTSAWLQFESEPGIPLHVDDRPRRLEDLSGLLQTLLDDERVTNRHAPELIIEFVLPHDKLNFPLERLETTLHGVRLIIGIVHPVVVRSYERMSRTIHHEWHRKTERFRSDARGWVMTRPGERDRNQLYAALAGPSEVCLAMTFPPQGGRAGDSDELWVGVHGAGVPIALWCRGADCFAAEMRDLLDADLTTLPERVRDLRRDAILSGSGADYTDQLGFQLGLLFDLADRVPAPYLRLRPPA